MSRTSKSVAAVTGLLAIFLAVMSFVWNGWAGEFLLLVDLILLMAFGLTLLMCRIRQTT